SFLSSFFLGPFFAIPRTGATSFSFGISHIFLDNPPPFFLSSLLFFGLSFFLSLKPSPLSSPIGKYFQPPFFFFLSLFFLFPLLLFSPPLLGPPPLSLFPSP
ncbi:hypothetical protein E0F64_10215, partial [Streptococcus pyogenes]